MLETLRAATGLLLLVCSPFWVAADIRLPKIFSDQMVLQRGNSVRIWGTADPGEALEITLGENSATTTADDTGKWTAQIVPPAAGGPYQLAVAGAASRVVFSEVYVGEVWICCGESNMDWSLEQSREFANDEARTAWLNEIDQVNIRLFTVPQNSIEEAAADFTEAVSWQDCRGENAAAFSATAYHFAVALQKSESLKGVPVGLIDCSCAATPAEAWTSRQALSGMEALKPLLDYWEGNPDKRLPNRPGCLFNGMVCPLIPLSVRGVVWYQGETNVGRGHQYREIMKCLINDWRARFEQGEFPFYMVQIAPHRYGDNDPRALAEIWDAQNSLVQIPNTGLAGTSDIGDAETIHPDNKPVIGHRLAQIALANCYGAENTVCCGPLFERQESVDGENRIRLFFKHAIGLTCPDAEINGFQVCGDDGEFQPAQASLDGEQVIVWSDQVSNPVQVRYLWTDTARGNLFNEHGLPAYPFRTDSFDLLSIDQDY